MIVLTFNGSRLLDLVELKVISWCKSQGQKGKVPCESYGWTSTVPNEERFYCVTGFGNLNRKQYQSEERIQISRMFKDWLKAESLLLEFSKSLQADFFYKENLEYKAEEARRKEEDSLKFKEKSSGVVIRTSTVSGFGQTIRNVKDAVIAAE